MTEGTTTTALPQVAVWKALRALREDHYSLGFSCDMAYRRLAPLDALAHDSRVDEQTWRLLSSPLHNPNVLILERAAQDMQTSARRLRQALTHVQSADSVPMKGAVENRLSLHLHEGEEMTAVIAKLLEEYRAPREVFRIRQQQLKSLISHAAAVASAMATFRQEFHGNAIAGQAVVKVLAHEQVVRRSHAAIAQWCDNPEQHVAANLEACYAELKSVYNSLVEMEVAAHGECRQAGVQFSTRAGPVGDRPYLEFQLVMPWRELDKALCLPVAEAVD